MENAHLQGCFQNKSCSKSFMELMQIIIFVVKTPLSSKDPIREQEDRWMLTWRMGICRLVLKTKAAYKEVNISMCCSNMSFKIEFRYSLIITQLAMMLTLSCPEVLCFLTLTVDFALKSHNLHWCLLFVKVSWLMMIKV